MSDVVDEHIAKAFASLADVSARELQATAEALTSRRHPLHDFAGVFREVAWSRENDSEPRIARFHVREYAERADEDLLRRIAEAEARFWGHARDAVLAYRDSGI
jgi:DNA-binding transcriptional regulator YbjK